MSDATPRLGLPWLMPAQAQKHVTVNESLGRLDALIQCAVQSRTVSAQPSDPAGGDAFILPAGASGADWDGFSQNDIVYFQDGAWRRIAARTGLTAYILDEGALVLFDGTGWAPFSEAITALSDLDRLGVGTAADAANPFAAKLNAALWTALFSAEGGTGDLRYTLNKESASHVVSLLFQSAWSGRAEIGLTGSDDLAVKVSADGGGWKTALSVDRATGTLAAPGLAALNGHALGGFRNRIINGDFVIHQRGGPQTEPEFTDRWMRVQTGGVAHVFTQENFALGQGQVDGDPATYLSWVMDGVPDNASIQQNIEDVRTLQNQTATYSFWARASEALTLEVRFQQNWNAGVPSWTFIDSAAFQLATGWTRFERTIQIPDMTGRTLGADHFLGMRFTVPTASAAPTVELTDIQLEPGPVATPFERRSAGVELALCQRFFQRFEARTENGSRHIALSPMRSVPTVTSSSGAVDHVTKHGFELAHTSAVTATIEATAEIYL